MAEFGASPGAGGPPVAGCRKAASGAAGASPETRRGEPVSNGNCSAPDAVKRLQKQPSCESPAGESAPSDSASKGIPRRSSLIKDGSRAGRDRKKTVSFSCSLSEKKISSAADCIHSMVEGSELKKIRPNSRVYQRYYMLDTGLQALCWEPSKKESDKARISLASMREVRTGRNTETFRTSGVYEQISEDCAFSIIYGDVYENLDLVANSAEVANIWVTGLRYLMQYGKHALDMLASSQDSLRLCWLEQLFSSAADSDGQEGVEEGIRLQSAVRLIQGVNPGVGRGKVERRFKELQRVRERMCGLTIDNGSGVKDHIETKGPLGTNERVTKQEFFEVFHDFCTRPEIYFLLVQFSSNKEFLDTKDLMRFLEAEQGMTHVSEDTSLKLIQSHEPSEEGQQQGYLSLDGFTSYLTSAECHLFDEEHNAVCQDMSQPLSHYYINSSHNTYLIEDQFKGPSDISGYIRALKMGCRCVEVDVWDGPDEEPVVCTGHTLSPPLALRCVLEAIGRFAFVASEYPLIICIENHCSPGQQKKLWQHLTGVLGEKLYANPPDEGDPYLPSPHALRHRILLKAKKLGPSPDGGDGEVSEEDEGAEMCQRVKAANSGGAPPGGSEKDMLRKGVTQSNPPHPPSKLQLLKDLSDLVTLCCSVGFIDFPTSSKSQKPWELCSFHESLAVRLAGESPGDFVNHNKHFLSRVYPSPMRIDSSNMNPQDLWKCGCQIVSMNFQTAGLMMELNTAWFRQNGNCGYVLRPAIMRQEVSYFSADTRDTVPGVSPQLLHVKVISGQNLPKPRGSGAKGDVVDPYVYVEIHGIPADCTERRTRTVTQNGDNPIFDESFEFQINLPELAMVRFMVLDDDYIGDEFIGQYTISLECLQPGYRHVPLQTLTGEELAHAKLFVHVALTNRRGGGKPHKRGLSVRKARKGRDYTALRDLGVRAVDEVFRTVAPLLREATDLRENMQNSVAVFRELCGVSAVANLMQCVLALSSRVSGPDGTPLLLFDLRDQYPTLEPQGPLPDVLRRVVSTYEMMVQASREVIELSDGIYERILHVQTMAMEFHEKLPSLAAKDGLKGRKVSRALESFSWNITILKGQADLLKRAKAEVQENMKQVHDAALTGNLPKGSVGVTRVRSQTLRGQDDKPATSAGGPSA
ncbi:putative inactive phospholipase C-like protein 2 [Scophthalmus maximus]|uniref:Phosphoinositide phospholipase C n=1 Tax=Scophthalmus maximus TaxID=52904 RepID=A0A2U9CYU8_SCOMX|nr:inactive phospholipase C-like protein 2 [Scophthalmus maximus]AWP21838.1 putative inactive phospholipase C-like protein 2 [Scophthalmus maximus]